MSTDWLTKMNNKKVILYVDKYATFNEVVNNFNDNDDYIVAIAFDANDAIEKVKVLKDKLFLLLMNTNLPKVGVKKIDTKLSKMDMTGAALYERYLQPLLSKDVPVIFQSLKYGITLNRIFTYRVKRLINAGIADIIFKPYDKEELLTIIDRLLLKFDDRECAK